MKIIPASWHQANTEESTPQRTTRKQATRTPGFSPMGWFTVGLLGSNLGMLRALQTVSGGIAFNASAPRQHVPPTFLGFSHEVPTATAFDDFGVRGYRELVQHLVVTPSQPFSLRVGGNTQDNFATPIPPTQLAQLRNLTDLPTRFIMGLNLRNLDLNVSMAQTQAILTGLPAASIAAFELGNEPDLYPHALTGQNYSQVFATMGAQLAQAIGGPRLAANANSAPLAPEQFSTLIAGVAPYVSQGTLTQHHYIGSGKDPWTPAQLISDSSVQGAADSIAPLVTLAHAANLTLRYGEINSLYGGGRANTSNSFGAALWVASNGMHLAQVGLDGFNLHNGPCSAYNAICATNSSQDGQPYAAARAPYYGMLLLARTLADNASLVPLTLQLPSGVDAWGLVAPGVANRLLLINRNPDTSVDLSISGMTGNATASTLEASSLNNTDGIRLGGQTFDNATDGAPQGESSVVVLSANATGNYSLNLANGSAVLVTAPTVAPIKPVAPSSGSSRPVSSSAASRLGGQWAVNVAAMTPLLLLLAGRQQVR